MNRTLRLPPSPTVDAPLHAILDRPLDRTVDPAVTFDRKERSLATAFEALPVDEAYALYARLIMTYEHDSLARKFARLSADRRVRLLAFLSTLCEEHP